MKNRADAFFAFRPDPAAVQLDDLRAQVQANAKAGDMPCMLALYTVITIEKTADILGLNAHTFILYAYRYLVGVVGEAHNNIFASGRIFYRVGKQVGQDRPDLFPV